MSILDAFIINQMPVDVPNMEIYPDKHVYVPPSDPPPSRFRRKKGYAGKTAQHYNRNYKSMPKGF